MSTLPATLRSLRRTRTRRNEAIRPNPEPPRWQSQPDGSRIRHSNGIRIVDRTRDATFATVEPNPIEHLVTWQEPGGNVLVLGLDAGCRPISLTTMYAYL
ncbi:MAG: hypothetical protein JWQ48_2694 [Conexibacter sp.]|jgi:hypothetical protein|nr:hypothetical protein [Conexibacter sp.]